MEKKPLISVIVPIYKVRDYLDECVESIINQTYNNLEIILVDDGSPDECPVMCDEWAKRDNRIRVIHKKNGGLSSARNAGLDVATGEYLCFVDSDDFLVDDAIDVLCARIHGDASIGVVSGKIYRWQYGQRTCFSHLWDIKKERVVAGMDVLVGIIDMSISFTVWNKLYKKNALRDVRFREGRNNEDTLFMYDLSKAMLAENLSFVEIPHYVYYYRYREDSICTSTKKPLQIDIIKNLQEMIVDSKLIDKRLYQTIYRMYVHRLYIFCDLLQLNDRWRKIYFSTYQMQLRKIPSSYIYQQYEMKDIINIFLLQRLPMVRKWLRWFRKK